MLSKIFLGGLICGFVRLFRLLCCCCCCICFNCDCGCSVGSVAHNFVALIVSVTVALLAWFVCLFFLLNAS